MPVKGGRCPYHLINSNIPVIASTAKQSHDSESITWRLLRHFVPRNDGLIRGSLIAVQEGTPLYAANSIMELNSKFAGTADIVEIWFTSYKGPGKIKSMGYGSKEQARRILQTSIDAHY